MYRLRLRFVRAFCVFSSVSLALRKWDRFVATINVGGTQKSKCL